MADVRAVTLMNAGFSATTPRTLPSCRVWRLRSGRKDPEAKIFFAPKSLRVGGFWLPELANEIAEATAFVLLVGAKGLGPWQVIEYYEALDRRVKEQGFPVVLVLLDGQAAPGLPFLRQLHWITTPDPDPRRASLS